MKTPLVDFLLVGSTKAATSTLYSVFEKHPNISVSKEKEMHYFSQGVFGRGYRGLCRELRSEEDYDASYAERGGGKLRGDFDPLTMHGPSAIERIYRANPNAKIMAVLRNPIERTYSQFLMDVREGEERRPFRMAIEEEYQLFKAGGDDYCPLIRLGFYAEQIAGFQERFGKENVRVWLYNDFVADAEKTLTEMCDFVGLNPEPIRGLTQMRENEAAIPRNRLVMLLLRSRYGALRGPRNLYVKLPWWIRRYIRNKFLFKRATISPMPDAEWQFLGEVYKDDVERLGSLLGRNLSMWIRDPARPAALPNSYQKAKQAEFFDEATDEEFEIKRPHGTGRLYEWTIRKKFSMAMDMLSFPLQGNNLLDICCGSGMAAEFYAERGALVTGLDISERSIARASERARRHNFQAKFLVGDAEKLPFQDGEFDVVTVHDGLHHLPNPHQAIREMARVARRAIIVIEPARSWLTKQAVAAGLALDYEEAGNYVYRFREQEVFDIAGAAGFQRQIYKQYFLYYQHEPFPAAKHFENTPLFYLFPFGSGAISALMPRLGNKICVVCEKG